MSTVILEENAISHFRVDINLSNEERLPIMGKNVGTESVSKHVGHSGIDRKGNAGIKYKRNEEDG
jgi:hypothetical protein